MCSGHDIYVWNERSLSFMHTSTHFFPYCSYRFIARSEYAFTVSCAFSFCCCCCCLAPFDYSACFHCFVLRMYFCMRRSFARFFRESKVFTTLLLCLHFCSCINSIYQYTQAYIVLWRAFKLSYTFNSAKERRWKEGKKRIELSVTLIHMHILCVSVKIEAKLGRNSSAHTHTCCCCCCCLLMKQKKLRNPMAGLMILSLLSTAATASPPSPPPPLS